MRHSQDKGGSPIARVLRDLPPETQAKLVEQEGGIFAGRVGGERDIRRESLASAVYEELRLLNKDQLYLRAGLVNPKGHPRGAYSSYGRQELIAMIIQQEVPQ